VPLPLPDLDTRRWSDLVDEGRALLPRHAPEWTNHNASDPGITLLELVAWIAESDVYRANRVPERHRRKFLSLLGYPPEPPRAALVPLALSLTPAGTAQSLPAGCTFGAATAGGPAITAKLLRPLDVLPVALEAVQTFDGIGFADRTRAWRDGVPFRAWGTNPGAAEEGEALLVGLDVTGQVPDGASLSLWLRFDGPGHSVDGRRRLAEAAAGMGTCEPAPPSWPCPAPAAEPGADPEATEDPETRLAFWSPSTGPATWPEVPAHHSAVTTWEYVTSAGWTPFPEDGVDDETRSLTLDGRVGLTLPDGLEPVRVGAVDRPLAYVRCRLMDGRPDAAPVLAGLAANADLAVQARAARATFTLAPGCTVSGEDPEAGRVGRLSPAMDAGGRAVALAFGGDVGPDVAILDYVAATGVAEGRLSATLVPVGVGNDAPGQTFALPAAPVASGAVEVWTAGPADATAPDPADAEPWTTQPDLDAAGWAAALVMLDATAGTVRFGDGEQGRVAPRAAPVLAAFEGTAGAAGNLPAGTAWTLLGADDDWNRAAMAAQEAADPSLAGRTLEHVADALAAVAAAGPGFDGADEESLAHAAGRAAEALWVHERLVELAPPGVATLDQLAPTTVLARPAPRRTVTVLDLERATRSVPGTRVARARAWAGLDPDLPCLQAPGTVTVIVLPELPLGRPSPTAGLLRAVRAALLPRRALGTRLVVVGPRYVEVTVRAVVQSLAGARTDRVAVAIRVALAAFLDPLAGGPNGVGWPLGRDVYRSEILQQIDQVPGVDHVLSLDLLSPGGDVGCANVCVGPTALVASGPHDIEVR
jgi:predicted phage baseplate assembly protein